MIDYGISDREILIDKIICYGLAVAAIVLPPLQRILGW